MVLADAPAEAEEKARWVQSEPVDGEQDPSRGTLSIERRTGKLQQIQKWRDLPAESGLSIRQLVIEVNPRHASFVGTPSQVADEWARYVRTGVADGFNLLPHLLSASLAGPGASGARRLPNRLPGHHAPRALGAATAGLRSLPWRG